MKGITHQVAEERSLALHREVARRLQRRPDLLDRARARVQDWAREGGVEEPYVNAWTKILGGSLQEVIDAITDPGEHGSALRQASPFAGAIDPRTRWRILRECERMRRAHDS